MAAGEATPFVIPTINIAPYLEDPTGEEAAEIIRDVRKACESTGFFSLVGHGIPREMRDGVLKAAETLFALPLEEKKKLKSPMLVNRGYELFGSQVLQEGTLPDLKEGFYIGRDLPSDGEWAQRHPKLNGPNIFPPGIPDSVIKDPTETYHAEILKLGDKIFEVLAKGLPYGDGIFDEYLSGNTICSLRLLHYPPQTSQDERQLGIGAHTDFGAITLLLQDDSGGLEVLDHRTGEFVPVAPEPDAFVVNIGDMLCFWTNNRFKSSTHRVINRTNKDRYSAPLFFDGNLYAKLAPFDGSSPAGGQILTVEDYLMKRFNETFLKLSETKATAY